MNSLIKLNTLLILLFFLSCSKIKNSNPVIEDETKVMDVATMQSQVYTTAHNTNLRLSVTDSVQFNDFKQPLETDASIFVDPTKHFQTFLGIGARLNRCFGRNLL